MKARPLIKAQARATAAARPAPDDGNERDMPTNATSERRPRVVSRRTLEALGCAMCLIMLTLATGWMLAQAGIGQVVYPPQFAANGNRDLNALLRAIELNDVPAARRLLRKQPPDVNVVDDWGAPPISYALRARGSSANELVDLLIAVGADVNGRGTDGAAMRPLHTAATLGRPDLVERLLRAGADVGGVRGNGWTALHFAAAYDDPQTAALLLAAGADPDAADDEGDTPLAVAVKNECVATAAVLAPSRSVRWPHTERESRPAGPVRQTTP